MKRKPRNTAARRSSTSSYTATFRSWLVLPSSLFGPWHRTICSGIGAAVTAFTGYDPLTARASNSGVDFVGAALGFGVLLAIVNTLLAHELTHRTSDPVGMFMGRWFFAMSGGIPFEVEHVYGHHHTVGQPYDASLSLRRHSYYDFFATAPIKQIVYAWDVEKKRLAKYGKSVFSIKNHMIQSALRITVVWTIVFLLGGWLAVAVYTLAFWTSKMLLEALGFMFHHGQVRDVTQPYTTRHSWNSNKRCSSVVLCNVTRHSEHHDNPDRPFYELSVVKPGEAPMLKYGAITTAFMAFIPPLFFRFFGPQILRVGRGVRDDVRKAAGSSAERGKRNQRVYAGG